MADAPIGARTFGEPMEFSSLSNRNPVEGTRTHERFDPYWDGLWSKGTAAVWQDFDRAKRQVASGLAKLPTYMDADSEESIESLTNSRNLSRSLDALGVLDNWRTLTAQQLAAFTGNAKIANGRSKIMREMFASSLCDIGEINNGLLDTRRGDAVRLYRPNRSDSFDQKVRPRITYPEWVSVTGGTPFESGRQFDRHNLLATEFALRVAEFTDAALVLGEKMATHELLAHTSIGFPVPDRFFQRSGDLVIVREDGARIVVEVTATRGSSFLDKVRRWTRILGDRRMAKSGLSVIFLSAEHPDTSASKRWNVRNGVYRYLSQAVREFPGVSFDRTAERIGVVDWREWFPEPGKVSPDFLSLVADVPTGEPSSPWERKSFLDIFDLSFEPDEPERFTAVLDNAAMLRSVPRWMRSQGTAPDLTRIMHARSDYAHLDLRTLQKDQSEQQSKWFSPARPPERLRG